MIRFALLDIGDVILEVEWTRFLNRIDLKIDPAEFLAHHRQKYDLFERDQVSTGDFVTHLLKAHQLNHTHDQILEAWNSVIIREVPGVFEVLQKHAPSLQIYGLSNANRPHIQEEFLKNPDKYPTCKIFKKVFTSFELGCRKPEPEIYLKCLAQLGATPDQVLFVDDRDENIQAARNLGIHAQKCYRSATKLDKILTAL